MEKTKEISLVVVCDNHLAIMLGALLKSIELSHHSNEIINIYAVDDNITSKNKKMINATVFSDRIRILWMKMEEVIPESYKLPIDNSTYPSNIFIRLFIPFFLPANVEKAIYLDVDMLVLKDIKHLWEVDIQDNTIAAVTCKSQTIDSPWGGIKNYAELGLDPKAKYFNSGLLVINLSKWRNDNITESILKVINDNQEYITYPDQYGLNVEFVNNWYELDFRWNNHSQRSNTDPYIIHFTQTKPIFKSYKYNLAYKDQFYDILNQTVWIGTKPKGNLGWQFKRVQNLISKGSWSELMRKGASLILKR